MKNKSLLACKAASYLGYTVIYFYKEISKKVVLNSSKKEAETLLQHSMVFKVAFYLIYLLFNDVQTFLAIFIYFSRLHTPLKIAH